MIDEEKPLNFEDDDEPLDFEDEEFIDDKKERTKCITRLLKMALVSILLMMGHDIFVLKTAIRLKLMSKCISLKRLVFLIFKYKCNIRALSQTAKVLNDQRKNQKGKACLQSGLFCIYKNLD